MQNRAAIALRKKQWRPASFYEPGSKGANKALLSDDFTGSLLQAPGQYAEDLLTKIEVKDIEDAWVATCCLLKGFKKVSSTQGGDTWVWNNEAMDLVSVLKLNRLVQ